MSAALFLITHEGIASNLIKIGEAIIQKTNNNLSYHEIPMDADIKRMTVCIDKELEKLDTEQGLLVITDVYGSTPSNVAQTIADKHHADLISGVNLPMIIRLLNYRDETTESLIKKALDGAKKGIHHHASKT